MATTMSDTASAGLQELARRHLWLHFSRMGAYDRGAEIPIITRGEGCYVWDDAGNRYLDALSSLFCVNIGHGRADIAQAGADQARELGFFTNWSYAHPRAIELAGEDRVADARRPQPRLLHLGRRRVGRDRAQGRAPVPQADRQPEQDEGHRARGRLPRHDARRAQRDRRDEPARAVRAVHAGRLPRRRTRTSTGSRPGYGVENLAEAIADADRVRGAGDGRRRDPRAGAERRRLLHAARGLLPARARDLRRARGAAASPTRSSARGAGSATGSAPSATATSRTSSRRPRGSPRRTRRWGR